MIKEYIKDDIVVSWDAERCIHSGICYNGLPTVFKPNEHPWIQTKNETKARILEQVLRCPSKALSIKK
jgi:uncharacterized Fe-S cluster protein YjdI